MIAYIFSKLCHSCKNIIVKTESPDLHKIIRFNLVLIIINGIYGVLLLAAYYHMQINVDFYTVFYTSDCVLTLLSVFNNVLLISLSLNGC